MGITIELSTLNDKNTAANFILPTDLSCWFTAPKGEFHTSQRGVKIINPDYLVTWDIYQVKDKKRRIVTNKITNNNGGNGSQEHKHLMLAKH